MRSPSTTGRLLYDADCAFCTRVARQLRHLPLHLDVVPLQSVDLVAHGIDPARATRQIPYLPPAAPPVYGHRAFAAALGTGPWWCRSAGRVITAPLISALASWGYTLIARNRHRLPGGTASCELPERDDSG